ncbi:hypothetical protein DSCO28_11490 [Desulfosarcina ovata subsp. sediminis]|uniref:Glycosyltransferase 2-like domain-containing protein n=1 Tax=Desulfosarcina ovata subsp. sediminis TaxID=885957 RepID=A0A5K7ZR51_9BACT|nr:glycosyltransferase family 2 protein [Desulfosarcina ovata]BBO80583.1 hypothetical protein DSCO28_11490 [Desulfosarcina ovata subsp. sediminis]
MTSISVVIPTYNYGHFIRRAIDSILNQTVLPGETIIVDDGSTDNTEKLLLDNYLLTCNEHIKYLKKENGGPASARNFGIKSATGEYILLLDADDSLQKNAVELLTDKIKQFPDIDMIIGGCFSVTPSHHKKYRPAPIVKESRFNNFKALLNNKFPISCGRFIVKKSILENIKFPERLRHSEDLSVFAHLIANCNIITVDAPLISMYHHDDSLRHNHHFAKESGLLAVDEIFDKTILPSEYFRLKSSFYVHRCLSIFRMLYKSRRYDEAKHYYKMALRRSFWVLFKWRYLSKYIRMQFYAILKLKNRFIRKFPS